LPPGQRATIVGANLLVPAGVLFFGWNAAAAVFLVWLDMLLVSLRLGVLVFAAVSPLLAWIAIELAVRGYQILHRRAAGGLGIAQIGEQVLALMFRAVILITLASLASWFGRAGLVAFLFAAGAFLMYTELHENWLAQLYRRFNPSP
jgi:hypothetical protein